MLICQLNPDIKTEKTFLNAALEEIGIGFAAGVSSELETICGDRVLLLVMDFGAREENQPDENQPIEPADETVP